MKPKLLQIIVFVLIIGIFSGCRKTPIITSSAVYLDDGTLYNCGETWCSYYGIPIPYEMPYEDGKLVFESFTAVESKTNPGYTGYFIAKFSIEKLNEEQWLRLSKNSFYCEAHITSAEKEPWTCQEKCSLKTPKIEFCSGAAEIFW